MHNIKDTWDPGQYEQFKDERSQPFFDLKALLRPCVDPCVVDLGCGTGELTAILHRDLRGHKTAGLDSSAKMLEKARLNIAPGLSFVCGDIDHWEEENKFDIIFSNAALQWCTSSHRDIFKRLRRALKDKGQLAVQIPMNHDYATHRIAHLMSLEEPWCGLLKDAPYDKAKTMLTAEEYAALLFKLGFKEQKVFLRVYSHILDTREDVIEWVKGTLLTHFQSRLSAADYSKFLEAYRLRVFAELPDEKPFFYPFKRILMWASA